MVPVLFVESCFLLSLVGGLCSQSESGGDWKEWATASHGFLNRVFLLNCYVIYNLFEHCDGSLHSHKALLVPERCQALFTKLYTVSRNVVSVSSAGLSIRDGQNSEICTVLVEADNQRQKIYAFQKGTGYS